MKKVLSRYWAVLVLLALGAITTTETVQAQRGPPPADSCWRQTLDWGCQDGEFNGWRYFIAIAFPSNYGGMSVGYWNPETPEIWYNFPPTVGWGYLVPNKKGTYEVTLYTLTGCKRTFYFYY